VTTLHRRLRTPTPLFPAIVAIFALSGCSSLREWYANGCLVGPNYRQPAGPVASEWIDSRVQGVVSADADCSQWWRVFNDPVLNGLVQTAQQQNLSLRSAGTRILAARAQRDIAAGNLLPQSQQVYGDVARVGLSDNVANPAPNRFFDNNAYGFALAWELDFWGRFRRGVEAADAELEASIANYDDAMVILNAEIASTYVEIRVFQQRLKFVADNIAIQRKLVEQADSRLEVGVGRRIDQAQQGSNLTDTLALNEQLEVGLRLANNRLCVLLGIPVRNLLPELGEGEIPTAPPEVAVGMPADLLRRRPDLRRAERQVAAQSARIGIAAANLYPRFNLLGSIGYEAENFGDLFDTRALTGTVGPSLRWDVLNYGRLTNGVRVQDALFQTAAIDYQNAVLRAGREVEDGLVLYLRSQKQARQLAESAKLAGIAADEVITLSKDVKFDLNQAFVTSNFLVVQQDKLARSRGAIAEGLIQIYKALGGGWEVPLNQPADVQQAEQSIQAPPVRNPMMGLAFGPPASPKPNAAEGWRSARVVQVGAAD
jgi:NodT family efflux transporter outer membrane factor (OMF) lipoprotein